ncbi:hypothetical protein BDV93DRAFT_511791 [Ceratobasidium sp. AG-I]|nr:hypothetical protein BDV93DRAFT_511791 [Ceratobasidium sp. AG-I]
MTTTSPTNTVLVDPGGTEAYKISTPFKVGNSETTITRKEEIIATIQWKPFARNTLTMNGITSTVQDVFPRSKAISTSRVYTTAEGLKFKWKGTEKLYCVSEETDLNLATYDRYYFAALRGKVRQNFPLRHHNFGVSNGSYFNVVTWVIAEKKARDRRRARRNGGAHGGG